MSIPNLAELTADQWTLAQYWNEPLQCTAFTVSTPNAVVKDADTVTDGGEEATVVTQINVDPFYCVG